MNIWYLYFLLPVILFPAVSVINVLYGRKIGARKISLYRQVTLVIVWSPILLSLLSKWELLRENALMIFLCGLIWASYLTTAFHAMNLTSVGISRSFVAVSRTVAGFVIWYFIFQESLSFYDIIWIVLISLGFYLLARAKWEHFTKTDINWILISLFAWILFSINTLIFKTFAISFSWFEAAYLLESSSMIFLAIFMLFTRKQSIQESFSIDFQKLKVLFLTAPFILLASYWLAKSINLIPFYIFNTLFIFVLIVSIILSWIFLKEKFTLQQLVAMWIMVSWCGVVILF